MTRVRSLTIFGSILLLVLAYVGWLKFRPVSLCAKLSCIHMEGVSSFRQQDIYSNTPNVFRALYTDNQRFIRIEARRTTGENARQEQDAAVTKIIAMFEKAPAPYPGEISDAIVCDPGFVPTHEILPQPDQTKADLFIGYLNNRMTFGSCSQSQAVYRGMLVLTYCPNLSLLLRVELIASISDFTEHEKELRAQIQTFQCGT